MRISEAEKKVLANEIGESVRKLIITPLQAERDEWKRRALNAEDRLARIGRRAPERMRT